MNMLLAFAPFIAFAAVERVAGPLPGLLAGALVSLALLLRDAVAGRSPKVLEIGTCILFAALATCSLFSGAHWSVVGVRLGVDAGLLLIVLSTLLMRRPFTMQYAREQAPQAVWSTPGFIRSNYVITAAWALAFAVMVGAELTMLYAPQVPSRLGVAAIVVALMAAFKFTRWYPQQARASAATAMG